MKNVKSVEKFTIIIKKTFKSYRDVQKASRNYKKAMNFALKTYKFEEQKKLKNLRQNDSKLFWKSIKKRNKIEKQPINELYNHFKNINESTVTFENIASPHIPNFNDSLILNDKITKDKIMQAIRKLKNGKSPGIDQITNEYIKTSVHIFLPVYEDLFNTILDTGIFPSQWSIGIISPIYKGKGSNEDPSNFRPISLLSCLGKVFTSILNSRLTSFLDENSILNENQAGFREGYSTIDHILTLHLLLEYMKFNKNTMFCCFMDLSKAYDKINRIKLFQKLELFDIKGKFFNVVLSMYSQTKSLLKCNGLYTNSFNCNIGIRQGENLSSLLFSIFLNDLESYLNENDCDYIFVRDHTHMHVFFKLFILLYADDTVLLATSISKFRKIMKEYENYCALWNVEINFSKSKIMIFGTQRKNVQFHMNNIELEIVKEYHYLGITFTKNRRLIQTIKENTAKGKRAMFAIITRAKNEGLTISCQIHLFKTIVLPILLYGCEVWGFEDVGILEKVQIYFCRHILKLNKTTQKNILLYETGLIPINILVKCRVVKNWVKIMTGKTTKYVRKMVECLLVYYLNTEHKSNWIHFIDKTLTENGMRNFFLNPYSYRHDEFTLRLEDQFHQEVNNQLNNSNRTLFYRAIKAKFGFEEILDEIKPPLVYYLMKFKVGNHKLPVETGRWDQTPHNERYCHHCIEDIGDEFHYVFLCPLFSQLRKKYIHPYFYNRPNMYKAALLFQRKNRKDITRLCMFIKIIVDYFNEGYRY